MIISDEFSPGNASSDDDEETIAKEEAHDASDKRAEILALHKESQMDLDDLDFISGYLKNRDKIILSEIEDDDDEEDSKRTSRRGAKKTRARIIEEESNVRFRSQQIN